jgi:hypothetical protein
MMMVVMCARLPLRLQLLLQLRHRRGAISCRVASRRSIGRRLLRRTCLQELVGILANTTNATAAHTTSFQGFRRDEPGVCHLAFMFDLQ